MYQSVIGWEHGNLKNVARLPIGRRHDSYEARTYGDDFDWALFETNLHLRISWVFGALQPDLLLVWNGHTLPTTNFAHIAEIRSIPIRYMTRGLFPCSVFIDSQGPDAHASLRSQTFYRKDFQKHGEQGFRMFESHYRPIGGSEEPLSSDSA